MTNDTRTALPPSSDSGLRAAIDKCVALGCIRMHWGATKPCDEYNDGRELCGPCALRAALAASPDPAGLDEKVDRLEAILQPNGRCVECGGGEGYWKHGPGDPLVGFHMFQRPEPIPMTDPTEALDLDRLLTLHFRHAQECRETYAPDAPNFRCTCEYLPHLLLVEAALDRSGAEGLDVALERLATEWQREADDREGDPKASGASLLASGVLARCARQVRIAVRLHPSEPETEPTASARSWDPNKDGTPW